MLEESMKKSGKCPKCSATEIVRVAGRKTAEDELPIRTAPWYALDYPAMVDRYVCCKCGFVELWVQNDATLSQIHKFYTSQQSI
jgi:ribosomal protein S27AE